MYRNHYWDLFECRWVHYRPADVVAAADAVPAPRSAETESEPEPAGA